MLKTGSTPATSTKKKPLKPQWFQGFSLRDTMDSWNCGRKKVAINCNKILLENNIIAAKTQPEMQPKCVTFQTIFFRALHLSKRQIFLLSLLLYAGK